MIYSISYNKLLINKSSCQYSMFKSLQTASKAYNSNLNQPKPQTGQLKYTDFSSEEYSFICNSIEKVNDVFMKKKTESLLFELFNESNVLILNKFIKNADNWSLIFSNYSYKCSEKLGEAFYATNLLEAIRQNQLESKNLLFYLDLAESLNEYFLFRRNNLSISFENLVKLDLDLNDKLNFYLHYFEILIDTRCTFLSAQIKADKQAESFHRTLSRLNETTNFIMKQIDSIDGLYQTALAALFRAFCFIQSKWLNTVKLLSSQAMLECSKLFIRSVYTDALSGAIRFDNAPVFNKLVDVLNERNNSFSLNSIFFPGNEFYDEYFELKGEQLQTDLNRILTMFQTLTYVPNKKLIDQITAFINK